MTRRTDHKDSARFDRIAKLLTAKNNEMFEASSKRFQEARELFHEELAEQFAGPLNEELKRMPKESCEEKQALCRWANAELRALGLAVKCPKTGEAAALHVLPSPRENARFQFELIDHAHGRHRTITSTQLPVIALRSRPQRREPQAEYWRNRLGDPNTAQREH